MMSFLIGLLISQNLFAKTYGGTGSDYGYPITRTADGGCAMAGQTHSFGAGQGDILVIKLDASGNLTWARTYGGTKADYAYSIIQTADGGYAIAGETFSYGTGTSDCLILKLDASGSLTWARTFGGTMPGGEDPDGARSIVQTADGGYAVAGYTWNFGAGLADFLVFKLDAAGNLTWARTYGGTGYDYAWSIIQAAGGGFAVAGYTGSFGAGGNDALLIRMDNTGTLQWARTVGGPGSDNAYSMFQCQQDSGFIAGGGTDGYGSGYYDFFAFKLSQLGNLQWARAVGEFNYELTYSIARDSDDGAVMAGCTSTVVLKLSSSGSLVWARTLGWGDDPWLYYGITRTTDGGFAIAGYSYKYGAGSGDYMVLKVNSGGNYSGCVSSKNPVVTSISPSVSSPNPTVTTAGLEATTPSPTTMTPSLSVSDVCSPAAAGEGSDDHAGPGITCSSLYGAALFISPEDVGIKIYKADGRLAYSGELRKGENRIPLEIGVYLWTTNNEETVTRNQKGKVAVR